jgi:steroid delta-isomerase-like uncharacterized protein
MSTEENKALVRRYNEEVWSRGNVDAVDEMIAADLLWGNEHVNAEGVKQFVTTIRSVFPDFQVTIEDMIAEGDKVAVRMTHRATHLGEWKDSPIGTIPPTGKQVAYTGIVVYRIANNRIVEDRAELDMLSLLQQLGAIPAPG